MVALIPVSCNRAVELTWAQLLGLLALPNPFKAVSSGTSTSQHVPGRVAYVLVVKGPDSALATTGVSSKRKEVWSLRSRTFECILPSVDLSTKLGPACSFNLLALRSLTPRPSRLSHVQFLHNMRWTSTLLFLLSACHLGTAQRAGSRRASLHSDSQLVPRAVSGCVDHAKMGQRLLFAHYMA